MIEAQWRAARALVGWSQDDLAQAIGASVLTIKRLEAGGQSVSDEMRGRAMGALESAGVIFVEENGEGPGVRLRKVHAKCGKCGYTGTVEHHLTSVSGVPTQCPTGASPIACPEFRKAVSAANTALRLPNQEKAAKFAAKARGDQSGGG